MNDLLTKLLLTELQDDITAVTKNLEAREWLQGGMVLGNAVCAHGAVMTCAMRPGDEQIVRAVMRAHGLTEDWNDTEGRTKDEVLARFRQIEVTDKVLALTYGPQWSEIVALVRRTAVLTADEASRVAAAWEAAGTSEARDAARVAAWSAARATGAAWETAWATARNAARDATGAAWVADGAAWVATGAAWALVVRDLIGQHGFTQEHFDLLVGPWESVTGMDLHGAR